MSAKHYESKRQMFMDLGVSKHTLDEWLQKPWFPRKTKWGWNKADVLAAVEKYNQAKQARMGSGSARDRKTRLECEKLEVVIAREREALKLAELETAQREGRLVLLADVQREWTGYVTNQRQAAENWRNHALAKYPKMAELINDLVDGFIDTQKDTFTN